jgi:alpha-L-fucosidase
VLTSKHHDGYTLWPSAEANRSWGRPWNSVDTGPQRDLLGELSDAVNETSLKMGIYFSIYEWFNPLYTNDKSLYVDKHFIPQFKDVVNRYKPAVIFSDGEWDESDKFWKSESLLAWLFNEAPNKDYVVVNDRWGKDSRHQHGGYYTTEYGAGLPNANHPWEENRGMGFSYGYNRAESIDNYNSAKALVFMLIDIVSRGGNFLLDVGPTGDGRIPVIMQERLVEMGEWLKVNGEAIYGTTTWKKSEQWSEGEQYAVKGGRDQVLDYDILKLTVSPDPGRAVKEVFFTKKGSAVYAIAPKFPVGQLVIKDLQSPSGSTVSLLGYHQPLSWNQKGKDLVITMPNVRPDEMAVNYGFVFKVENGQ